MSFRPLYEQLQDYQGRVVVDEVLEPWIRDNQEKISLLRAIGSRVGYPIPEVSQEELWFLYSASRVIDLLALSFQSGQADRSGMPSPAISMTEFERTAKLLGLDIKRPQTYSPFHHEITELTCAPLGNQPPRIVRYDWPCLMLGSMLFTRAGVALSSGLQAMHPDVAAHSTLYWAHLRKTRPHHDLAQGWGHNSSWCTNFRRDFFLNNTFHFNVDGKDNLADMPDGSLDEVGLNIDERRELLINRCFITVCKDSSDLFPYDDQISLSAT